VSDSSTERERAVRVRSLTMSDIPRVMEIEQAAFSMPWHAKTFEGLLQRTDTDLVAAERDGKLVGYAVCWTVIDQSELGNVAVAPEARGEGVGRMLMDTAMERIRRRGAVECFLEVRESNQVARSLYLQGGFEQVGHRKRYYSNPVEDALVMRKRL
jgi:ribosomal-protein-alanine N-acetyltransferase